MKNNKNLRFYSERAQSSKALLIHKGYKFCTLHDFSWYEKMENLIKTQWLMVMAREHIDGYVDVGIKQVHVYTHTGKVVTQEILANAIFCKKYETYNSYTLKQPKGKKSINVAQKISQAAHTWIMSKLSTAGATELQVPNRKDAANHEVALLLFKNGSECSFPKPDYIQEF